jgi:hypothetical protein
MRGNGMAYPSIAVDEFRLAASGHTIGNNISGRRQTIQALKLGRLLPKATVGRIVPLLPLETRRTNHREGYMPLTKIGMGEVFEQSSPVACGSAAAVNVLRAFGVLHINDGDAFRRKDREVFEETRTVGFTDRLGSTPERVLKYVMGQLGQHVNFCIYLTNDSVPAYKSIDGLINFAMLSSLKKAVDGSGKQVIHNGAFTENDLVIRFVDVGVFSGHFIVQTNFDGTSQFLDSGRGVADRRYVEKDTYSDFIRHTQGYNVNQYKSTNINLALRAI